MQGPTQEDVINSATYCTNLIQSSLPPDVQHQLVERSRYLLEQFDQLWLADRQLFVQAANEMLAETPPEIAPAASFTFTLYPGVVVFKKEDGTLAVWAPPDEQEQNGVETHC